MATVGTLTFTVRVDPSRVKAVTDALTMLCNLAESYGHAFTEHELEVLAGAHTALERENLETSTTCASHGRTISYVVGDVARCANCRVPVEWIG